MKDFLLVKEIDKANHFIVGYMIYFFSYVFLDSFLSIIPVLILAGGKEIIDMYRHKQKFDWEDFAYTMAGCIPSLFMTLN